MLIRGTENFGGITRITIGRVGLAGIEPCDATDLALISHVTTAVAGSDAAQDY